MRRKVTLATLKQFMQELAAAARSPGKVYITGGATALLLGFREQTIDIDLKLDPELIRYPAIEPRQFRKKLEEFLGQIQGYDRARPSSSSTIYRLKG
jgi:hypothetical protein